MAENDFGITHVYGLTETYGPAVVNVSVEATRRVSSGEDGEIEIPGLGNESVPTPSGPQSLITHRNGVAPVRSSAESTRWCGERPPGMGTTVELWLPRPKEEPG